MLVHIKVESEAKEDSVYKKSDTSYIVSVREEAKENMANKKMLFLMAKFFNTSPSAIRIITGHHTPSKIIEILGR